MKTPTFLFRFNGIQFTYTKIFFLFILFTIPFTVNSQQLAFPTAKGAAAHITGGRGGQIIHVTNLNESGPGSLTEALQTQGPRIIVFDVGGTIDLTGLGGYQDRYRLVDGTNSFIYNDFTIAGQTAPGGITILAGGSEFENVDNFIIRYVRFKSKNAQNDAVEVFDCHGVIFDHCSILYGNDETLTIRGNDGIVNNNVYTVQSCLLADGKTGMILGMSGPRTAENQDTQSFGDFTLVDNAFINISHRFPNPKGANHGQYDVINNVIYNWRHRQMVLNYGDLVDDSTGNLIMTPDIDINYIGNVSKTASALHAPPVNYGFSYFRNNSNQIRRPYVPVASTRIYTGFNKMFMLDEDGTPGQDEPHDMDIELWRNFNYTPDPADEQIDITDPDQQYFESTPFPLKGQPFAIKSADDAWEQVLADVGANAYLDDNHNKVNYSEAADAYVLAQAINDSGTRLAGYEAEFENGEPNPDYDQVHTPHNGYSRPANWDTDGDGMPDTWESANGFNPNVADNNGDADGDGYTNIEEYLNLIDGDIVTIDVTGVTVTPSTATINIPETITLTKTIEPANASNQLGVWSSSNTDIATVNTNGVVTPVSEGEVIITFNSNDGGFSDSATITVTNIPIDVESVSLSPETLELNIYATASLTADVLPVNATDITGVWASSDLSIATVDQEGLVQPVAVGETTITFTTNDGGLIASATVIVNDDKFGSYEFYNADTDNLIQLVDGGEVFNLDNVGENINFRIIPAGGDSNPDVESVGIQWSGIESGVYGENAPIYAGMNGHIGNDYQPYTVTEGTYNFTVTYYTEDSQSGSVLAVDNFTVDFIRGSQVNAGADTSICQGDAVTLTATDADSYVWSTGETTASIIVSPDTTTEYTVTGSHTNGTLTTTDSVTVTVNQSPTINAGEDQTICQGDSITLTATTNVGSITWSNGETTSSITVSPSDTTTYVATGNNNGCLTTDEIIVNVNSAPNADAGNDATILLGNSIVLTASGGDSYQWSTGETTENITVSPNTDTTYSVDVFSSNGCSDSDTVTVSVVGPVVANAGEDIAICEGETVTLTATGGDTYLWNTGQTTQSITISPLNTTTYTVTVSDQFSTDSDEVIVTVNPAPIVSAGDDVTINEGDSVTLYASGGNTYLWSTGETNANISVSPIVTTTYSVSTTINGCSDTDEVTVTVINLVNASAGDDQTICLGNEVTLTASGGDTYQWSNGETTESITVNPQSTTTYSVTVTNDNGSDTDDVIVNVENCPAQDFEFRAFPNPTTGIINVKLAGLNSASVIQVTDILGKQLKYIEVQPNSGQVINKQIDLRGMTKGFYLITFYGDNRTLTKKMILK